MSSNQHAGRDIELNQVVPSHCSCDREHGVLPDLLNTHRLPPYSPPEPGGNQAEAVLAAGPPLLGDAATEEQPTEPGKPCCGCTVCTRCITAVTHFKWVLLSLGLLGIACVVSGIILGAFHMTAGSSFLTLSLMFIGLGVMLVVVVGIGWRCTPTGHEPCHLLFGLGEHHSSNRGRNRQSSTGRGQWMGGMLYPEFQHRRPPPAYSTSMREYQQQRLSSDTADYAFPSSPPPTYHSRPGTMRPGIPIIFPPPQSHHPSSGPPTYRSHISDTSDVAVITCPGCHRKHAVANTTRPSTPSQMIRQPRCLTCHPEPSSTLCRVHQAVEYLDNIIREQQPAEGTATISRGVQANPGSVRAGTSRCQHMAYRHDHNLSGSSSAQQGQSLCLRSQSEREATQRDAGFPVDPQAEENSHNV